MTQAWSIYVELGYRDAPDDLFDDLLTHSRLANAAPAIGTAPNGNLSVRLFVEASTARLAVDAGLKAVTTALRDCGINPPVVGVEVITEDELDRRNDEPSIPDLVGVAEIAGMLGVSRQRAQQLTDRDGFPPAVARLKSGPIFVREQVEAFERRWDRKGGRPRKPVDLTTVERDMLAALHIARNAIAHGERDHSALLEMLHAHASDPEREVRRVEPVDPLVPAHAAAIRLHLAMGSGRSALIAATLDRLAAKRMVILEGVKEGFPEENEDAVVDVDLTVQGERLVSL